MNCQNVHAMPPPIFTLPKFRLDFESFIRAVRTKSLDFIILYRTVVGQTSDGRRTAVRPSSDRCPTAVRRPSDGRPTAVGKISAKKKDCAENFFAEKCSPTNRRICDQDSLKKIYLKKRGGTFRRIMANVPV